MEESNQIQVVRFNDYDLLKVQPQYDADKVRQFAAAANERKLLMRRLQQLENLMRNNSDLALWTHTRTTGEVVALPDMDNPELNEVLSLTGGDDQGQYLEAELRTRKD